MKKKINEQTAHRQTKTQSQTQRRRQYSNLEGNNYQFAKISLMTNIKTVKNHSNEVDQIRLIKAVRGTMVITLSPRSIANSFMCQRKQKSLCFAWRIISTRRAMLLLEETTIHTKLIASATKILTYSAGTTRYKKTTRMSISCLSKTLPIRISLR